MLKEINPYKVLGDKIRLDLAEYSLTLKQNKLDAIWSRNIPGIITWRSWDEYNLAYPSLNDANIFSKQIVEVGAGLGECIPVLANYADKPPIIIDPIDYRKINFLLVNALKMKPGLQAETTIGELIRRSETNLSAKVIQYQMTLEQAYSYFQSELRGLADMVIDIAGAQKYSPDKTTVLKIESDLLRKM